MKPNAAIKHREFYIPDPESSIARELHPTLIHVIEYSAYEELRAALKDLGFDNSNKIGGRVLLTIESFREKCADLKKRNNGIFWLDDFEKALFGTKE